MGGGRGVAKRDGFHKHGRRVPIFYCLDCKANTYSCPLTTTITEVCNRNVK